MRRTRRDKYSTRYRVLARLNGIASPYFLYPHQVLAVPKAHAHPSSSPGAATAAAPVAAGSSSAAAPVGAGSSVQSRRRKCMLSVRGTRAITRKPRH
uniref:LysM peptidoglycan-binding domain-containing protein n=1 Tax=Burkholderia cepacia TaxID=292 RepID=UPI0035A25388